MPLESPLGELTQPDPGMQTSVICVHNCAFIVRHAAFIATIIFFIYTDFFVVLYI